MNGPGDVVSNLSRERGTLRGQLNSMLGSLFRIPCLHATRGVMSNYAAIQTGSDAKIGPDSFRVEIRQYLIESCERLVSQLGVYNSWIALLENDRLTEFASSLNHDVVSLQKKKTCGEPPVCLREIMNISGVGLISHPMPQCKGCPLAVTHAGRVDLATRIIYGGRSFGVVCVSAPDELADDLEIKDQFANEAHEIGRMLTDINGRREIILNDTNLRLSEALLDATQQLTHVGGWQWDAEREAMHWTPEMFRIHDISDPGQLRDSPARISLSLSCFNPGDREEIWALFRNCADKGISFDRIYPFTTPTGKQKWIRTIGLAKWKDDRIVGAFGNLQDITEQKTIEYELQENRRQLSSLMDNLPGMVYRCKFDRQWTMEFVSRGCFDLTGYEAEVLIGNRKVSYGEIIHPEDRRHVEEEISATLSTGVRFTIEYRIVRADGEVRWVWERGHIENDSTPSNRWVEGFIIDITERRKMEQRIIQMHKSDSLCVMAGGVAHDFNNILNAIIGNAEMAIGLKPESTEINSCLEKIISSGGKASDLCRQLLAFCGRGGVSTGSIDITQLIQALVPVLNSSVSPSVKINYQLVDDIPPFRADPTEIRLILMQLILNAAESYGEKSGQIILSVGSVYFDGKPIQHANVSDCEPSGWFVWLSVADHGCGMDAATESRMFDPFFSTKFTGRGMGLPAVNGIVKSQNGFLTVKTAPSQGTCIKVFIPVAEKVPSHEIILEPPAPRSASSKRVHSVLLVDDDDALRSLSSRILELEGIDVLTARDGLEAVDLYRENQDRIELVFMDLTMPRLDGIEACIRIRNINPAARIVLTTGYSEEDIASRIGSDSFERILLKPYLRKDLIALLR